MMAGVQIGGVFGIDDELNDFDVALRYSAMLQN